MMRALLVVMLSASISTALRAQDSAATAGRDSLFQSAQRLVNEGKGEQGRGIVDSLLKVTAPGTPAYAEALFWRASLATTSAEAERDYRQITVDYSLSSRTPDALLRLAQLELQRGERTLALAHLERLFRENGTGTTRARAAYWMGRVHFEMNDITRGCVALAESRAAMTPADVELRNQVDYAAQRCPLAGRTAVRPAPAPALPAPEPAATPAAASPPADTAIAAVDTVRTAEPQTAPATPPTTPPVVPPVTPAVKTTETKAPAATSAEAQRFSVQVAAYGSAQEAQRLVKQYRANGYDARVAGTVAPFRVRIGRFKTRNEAVDLAKVLKEKSGAAFVVVAEPR
jgi:cell division septation protein DedD